MDIEMQYEENQIFTENLEYVPEKFIHFLNKELAEDNQEKIFSTLNIVKNELIGQSDGFKQKLVTKHGIVEILKKYIQNYSQYNPLIVKEVITLLSTIFTFFDREFENAESKQKQKIECYKTELKSQNLFSNLPEILQEYLKNQNVKCDIFLIFINQLLEIEILEPSDFKNIFEILAKCIEDKQNIQLKILYISNMITILLSKNYHLLEQDPKDKNSIVLQHLKNQFSENLSLVDALLTHLIKSRLNISDQALISCLKALSWAARNDAVVCQHILVYDRALEEMLDLLKYPHKGIKIQVSSLLASLRKSVDKKSKNKHPYYKYQVQYLKSPQNALVFQWILIELMNQNLGGATPEILSQNANISKKEREYEINQFGQILDTIIDIVKFGHKKYNQLCLQIGLIDKIWKCYPIHKAKVFQVLKQICCECQENVEYIIKKQENFEEELYKVIITNDSNRELKYSAIDLLATLGGTENQILKQMLLDQHKYVQILSGLLIESKDFEMQMVLLSAINNFVFRNSRDFLKEKDLINKMKEFLDQQNELSVRCLFIVRGTLKDSSTQVKEEIMSQITWDRVINCLKSQNEQIQRLAIQTVLHFINENVGDFIKLQSCDQIVQILKQNLKSKDNDKIIASIKCFCVIAISKEWEYKQVVLHKEILDQIITFIFEEPTDEEVQEEAISFVRNLTFKNFAPKEMDKDQEEPWLRAQNVLVKEYQFSERLEKLMEDKNDMSRSSYKNCKEIAKQIK